MLVGIDATTAPVLEGPHSNRYIRAVSLAVGTQLGSYEVVSPIGKGGMGEVYRARDKKLERDVAIKVLPEAFAEEPERLQRFEREAKLLAGLNHPCIATLYGFEDMDGTPFLVMELVEGETLSERIARGVIPVDEAVPLFKQIAEGLESAHDKGIIHRDLKPANIKVTPDGLIKILDFGLAKALEEPGEEAVASQSPTLTRGTALGAILGTAAYMSPEQATGKTVDKRADIWAYGCVLYEALTAKKTFDGDSVSETIAAVIRAEPDWSALPNDLPVRIRSLLTRCLDKNEKLRLRDVGEARIAIESPEPESKIDAKPSAGRFAATPWLLALALGIIAAVLGWRNAREVEPTLAVTEFGVLVPASQTLDGQRSAVLAVSPDSRHLAYLARTGVRRQIHLHSFERMETMAIPGTEGAYQPFFSPDGRWIGYFVGAADGELKKISIDGGAPIVLTNARFVRGATWGVDGYIYFAEIGSSLSRVSANGGDAEPVTALITEERERSHRWPEALPGGDALIFTVAVGDDPSSYEDSRIDVVTLANGERRSLIERATMARYASSGHLVFARDGALFAAPFDRDSLRVTGDTVSVLDGVDWEPASGHAHFGVTADGTLAYASGAFVEESSLGWIDRSGATSAVDAPVRSYGYLKLSPDGTRALVQIAERAWVFDFARGTLTRVRTSGGELAPIWTRDGRFITFYDPTRDAQGLFWTRADGRSESQELASSASPVDFLIPSSWSPDGRVLSISDFRRGRPDVSILRLQDAMDASSAGEPEPLIATSASESNGVFHPTRGEWLAYQSDESGRAEIYVQAFPDGGERYQASADGGVQAAWSHDGEELFYLSSEGLWAVDVDTEPSFVAGNPRILFAATNVAVTGLSGYDVSPDGERFLVKSKPPDAPPVQFHVVLNWLDELKRLAPNGH